MCSGNTDTSEDIVCPRRFTLKANAANVIGRSIGLCCHGPVMLDSELNSSRSRYSTQSGSLRGLQTGSHSVRDVPRGRVSNQCAGNSDKAASPDILCPVGLHPRPNYASREGRSVEECCFCDQNADAPLGVCGASVSDSDPDHPADSNVDATVNDEHSVCTRVMKYAACGDDANILRCAHQSYLATTDDCKQCGQPDPYTTFQQISRSQPTRMQRLCMSAAHFQCTYLFHQALETVACDTGKCVGNTIESDIVCPRRSTLKANAANVTGRSVGQCCDGPRGFCSGNTDGSRDIVCSSPARLRADAQEIKGRDPTLCCERRGFCTGNTDTSEDIVCPRRFTLKANAANITGRSVGQCCDRLHGFCDIECSPPEQLRIDADEIKSRDPTVCCERRGLCTGNDDPQQHPDVVCPPPSQMRVDARNRHGRNV
eukprot:COSAG01_NODE_10317_length_2194_cov_1.877804_2_plen_427_part_01